MTYSKIINRVSKETGIDFKTIDRTYKAFWRYIKNCIEELPLHKSLSEETFNNLRTNFNIPSIGKLTCTYKDYTGIKNKYRLINSLHKKNEKAN